MNNIEKDQTLKNLQRKITSNQVNLFTSVALNASTTMMSKISSRRPNNINARFTPVNSIRAKGASVVRASNHDMTAHQKMHMMNDDSVNFNSSIINKENFMTVTVLGFNKPFENTTSDDSSVPKMEQNVNNQKVLKNMVL